jgi:hypothetical protein
MIEIKPRVVYKGDISSDQTFWFIKRKALIDIIQKDLACSVIEIESIQNTRKTEYKYFIESAQKNLLAAVLIEEYPYESENPLTQKDINALRDILGENTPIIVLGNTNIMVNTYYGREIYYFTYHSLDLQKFISQHKNDIQKYLDIERKNLILPEIQNLIHIYNENYPDNLTLVELDDNTKAVLEFIRVNILPSDQRKSEYDDHLPTYLTKDIDQLIENIQLYRRDINIIRNLNERDRLDLIDALELNTGLLVETNGIITKNNVSSGENVAGYAIELKSKEEILNYGISKHHDASEILKRKLNTIKYFRRGEKYLSSYNPDNYLQILSGLLHMENKYWNLTQTPLLMLWNNDFRDNEIKDIADYILSRHKYIPISSKGYILGEDPIQNNIE